MELTKKCYNQRCGGNKKMLQPKGVEVTKKCYYQKIQLPTYICRLYVATHPCSTRLILICLIGIEL